jgi:transcriptional regulator with XRE-family HTH domain/tetratricopeptide (TPR) repeat protein
MDSAGGSFGLLLRRYRAAANLTQEDLAGRSRVSPQAIGMLERGARRAPRPSTIALLADALELDPAERQALVAAAGGRAEVAAGAGQDPTTAVPGQLPRGIGDFTGRATEVELVRGLLESESASQVVVITGLAGVGKTTLALRAAHRHRDRFPDGQLFVDLRGAEAAPLSPGEVLAGFLYALGVDGGSIPARPDARLALYRARLLDRRVLVVLDNAADEGQVRDLLPSGQRCAALVTSRGPLSGLEAARVVPLAVLTPLEAVDLLARVAGSDRVLNDEAAARDIVGLCGCLPLAVRIAGARLAARRGWSLRMLATRLRDERRRLDELRAGDLEVRASLALSYRALDAVTRRGFRLLGLLDVPDFPGWLVGALLDLGPGETDAFLDRLADAGLLDDAWEDGAGQLRYRLHGLVRLFARELLREDDLPSGERALGRALGSQLALCERAQRAISPGAAAQIASGAAIRWLPADPELLALVEGSPFTWFEAERGCLVAGVGQACRTGFHEVAWEVACRVTTFFSIRGYWQDWQAMQERVVEATRRAGNHRGEMHVAWQLGECHLWLDDHGRAWPWLERGVRLAEELGDVARQAAGLLGLAFASVQRDELAPAEDRFALSIALFRRVGDRYGEAVARAGTALVLLQQGRLAGTAALLEEALPIFRSGLDRHWDAIASSYLARVHEHEGRTADAVRCLTRSLEIFRELGDRRYATLARCRLALVRHDRWGSDDATLELAACARVFRELGMEQDEARTLELLRQVGVDADASVFGRASS